MTTRAYIGLGSNLAEPAEQLRSALQALDNVEGTRLAATSAFYTSDSLLPGQPRYTNAVAAVDTHLAPLALLDALQAIELDQGRERKERWGPVPSTGRPVVRRPSHRRATPQSPALPHAGAPFRALSLAELVPADFHLADGRSLAQLLEACPFVGLERL